MFVTLRSDSRLRGCIGLVPAEGALAPCVVRCALAAATEDPRFPPVTPNELSRLRIEISVLSRFEQVSEVEQVQVGRHGLQVRQGDRKGLLLPQVAEEQGWDREALLEAVCLKAGLDGNAWKAGAHVDRFTAEVFAEGVSSE